MGTAVGTGAAPKLHPNTSSLALLQSPGWAGGSRGENGVGREGGEKKTKQNKKAPQAANLKHFHFK